jgi:hypothetical protein
MRVSVRVRLISAFPSSLTLKKMRIFRKLIISFVLNKKIVRDDCGVPAVNLLQKNALEPSNVLVMHLKYCRNTLYDILLEAI